MKKAYTNIDHHLLLKNLATQDLSEKHINKQSTVKALDPLKDVFWDIKEIKELKLQFKMSHKQSSQSVQPSEISLVEEEAISPKFGGQPQNGSFKIYKLKAWDQFESLYDYS